MQTLAGKLHLKLYSSMPEAIRLSPHENDKAAACLLGAPEIIEPFDPSDLRRPAALFLENGSSWPLAKN
jgi:hypothetical protein